MKLWFIGVGYLLSWSLLLQGATNEATPVLLAEMISEPENGRIHSFLYQPDANQDITNIIRQSDSDQHIIPFEELVNSEVVVAKAGSRNAIFISCPNCQNKIRRLLHAMIAAILL